MNKKRFLSSLLAVTLSASTGEALTLIPAAAYTPGQAAVQSRFSFWDWFGGKKPGDNSSETNEPTELELVEDETTVSEDVELRADTYAAKDSETQVKYFAATMYDYDITKFNQAVAQAEYKKAGYDKDELPSKWRGLYFRHGKYTNKRFTMYNEDGQSYTTSQDYAPYNSWTGDLANSVGCNGNTVYQGLAKSTLDANQNIVFQDDVTDAGLFNSDSTIKDIYYNVGIPYAYNPKTHEYDFDTAVNGTYFDGDPKSDVNMVFDEGNPQKHNANVQVGKEWGWFPFSGTKTVDADKTDAYHFGMKTTVPFTMTENGRMNPNDSKSDAIKFEFSGDDDVWVFIDGKLVLDLGGCRNGMKASIDFAANTWQIEKMESKSSQDNNPDTYFAIQENEDNEPKITGRSTGDLGTLKGTVFNEGSTTGSLNETRSSFALKDSHELTIFYLERGAGSSNCRIKFNLPVKDNVVVHKNVESKTQNGETSPLTKEEEEIVKDHEFSFVLYKDDQPVSSARYALLDATGTTIDVRSTDSDGSFTLLNGQSAKFVEEIENNSRYYVQERIDQGYFAPKYEYTAVAANGSSSATSTADGVSQVVTMNGSSEAEDSLTFVCTNYLDADLPNPTAIPADDLFVLDYGLPVQISFDDLLKNDTLKGDKKEITSVSAAGKFGTVNVDYANRTVTYTLTQPLTDVDVLTYVVTSSVDPKNGHQVDPVTGSASIRIVPATIMYYEEDFADTVSRTGEWTVVPSAQTAYQEGSPVGTTTDSPYGSDVYYQHSAEGKSHGSYYKGDSSQKAASISYTFTGTGTLFYATTSKDSAYLKVTVTGETAKNEPVNYVSFVDTRYLSNNEPDKIMEHIPVFSWNAPDYGTYTVTAVAAKTSSPQTSKYGSEFIFDGYAVKNPVKPDSADISYVNAAYTADGEYAAAFCEVRDMLLADTNILESGEISWDAAKGFVVFTDSNGVILKASEYKTNGPKNEVYMTAGQKISFSLANWDANSGKVYLGLKTPVGAADISINGYSLNITNTVDSYYDVTRYAHLETVTDENNQQTTVATFEITVNSGLLSVTEIRTAGIPEFVIIPSEAA